MAEGAGEIIVKGGSVDLDYDDTIYVKETGQNHRNATRRMTRVWVVDEGGVPRYDSGENPEGLLWTVTVFTR